MSSAFASRTEPSNWARVAVALVVLASVVIGLLATQSSRYLALVVGLEIGIVILIILSRNPWLGIASIAALAPLGDLQRIPGIPALSLTKLISLLMFIVWVCSLSREHHRIKLTNIGMPFMALVAIFLISTVYGSSNLVDSLVSWSTMLSYLLIFLVIVNQIESTEQIVIVAKISILMAGAVGTLAVLQFITGRTLFPTFLVHETLRRSGALINRVVGTNYDPNAGALVPVLGLPLALALFAREKVRRWQYLIFLSMLLMAFHLLVSFSRSAWIGTTIPLLIELLLIGRKRFSRISMFILGLVAVVSVSPIDAVWSRVAQIVSVDEVLAHDPRRISLYQSVPLLVRDHWFLGVGLGNFPRAIASYTGIEYSPHSIPIAVVGQGGVIGLSIYIWLFANLLRMSIRVLRTASDDARYIQMGLLSSVISWQVMGLLNSYLFWIVGWIMVALLVSHAQICLSTKAPEAVRALHKADPAGNATLSGVERQHC